jgi:hypothetical protein
VIRLGIHCGSNEPTNVESGLDKIFRVHRGRLSG